MRKIRNFLIRVLLIGTAIFAIFQILANRGYEIETVITAEPKVNEPVKVEIKTTDSGNLFTPETINVEIYNKYNKSEKIILSELTSFDIGKYLLYVTPEFTGEYIVNITITNEGEETSMQTSFLVM